MLAENIVPMRPGRTEPRVVKRTEQRFLKMKKQEKTIPSTERLLKMTPYLSDIESYMSMRSFYTNL